MFATFQALFRALRTASTAEARSLSRVLCFYILSGYILATIQLVIPKFHNFVEILGIATIGANAYQLFQVSRLVRLTAIGEALELVRVIPAESGITANKLIGMYWNIAVQLFIFMTGFCLLIPHIPLQREWWLAIAWPTLFIFVGVVFGVLGRMFLQIVSISMLIFAIVTVLSTTFPQVSAQFHFSSFLDRILPNELADQINSISQLRQQQREMQIKSDLEEVRVWVSEHPNTPYPEDYESFLKSVSNGANKTLSEVRAEILREKENPPLAIPQEKYGNWETVDTFSISITNKTLNILPGKNGENMKTGEVWIPYILIPGWEYRITFSGSYKKRFDSSRWIEIPWQGNDAVAGQRANKPFDIPYGALVLRIGNQYIFPAKNSNQVFCRVKKEVKIFAELNINREPGEYFWTKLGYKLRNKNLSIKIERRRILNE